MTADPEAPPIVRPSFRRRIVAATALVSTIGMAVLVFLVVFVSDRSSDREVQTTLSSRLAAVLATTSDSGGRLHVSKANDALYDTLTWVFDPSGRRLEGPNIPASLQAAVAQRAASSSTGVSRSGDWRLDSQPIVFHGRTMGRAVVAVNARPYLSALGKTALGSVVLGLTVIAGTCLLAWLIVGRALAPVAAMTATAGAWSENHLDRRFGLGPARDEITALGAVLDSLLERVGTAIRAEQRLTAELAHELRTPLTVIRGEAQLGRATPRIGDRERDRFARIEAAAVDMSTAMTTLLDVARGTTGADAVSEVAPVLQAVVARHARARVPTEVRVRPDDLLAAVPGELLERIVAPIVDNAVRYASSRVTIDAESDEAEITVRIGNDGEAVDTAAGDLFVPGVRGAESEGAGLGLPLARRLARSVGGDVRLDRAAPPEFAVVLPRGGAIGHQEDVSMRAAGDAADPQEMGIEGAADVPVVHGADR